MLGLYYLPMPTICHELNMTPQGASKALGMAFEGAFAAYDHDSEIVFVYEMARFQIGERLLATDNKVKAIEKMLQPFKKCSFFKAFLDKYATRFHIKMEAPSKGVPVPVEAPSEGRVRARADTDQDQDTDQDTDHEQDHDTGGGGGGGPTLAAFAEEWNRLGRPFANIQGLTKKRTTIFQARCREPFFRENWLAALKALPETPFLRGEGGKGWVADVDFFLRPDSVVKIIEGKYAASKTDPLAREFNAEAAEYMRRVKANDAS